MLLRSSKDTIPPLNQLLLYADKAAHRTGQLICFEVKAA